VVRKRHEKENNSKRTHQAARSGRVDAAPAMRPLHRPQRPKIYACLRTRRIVGYQVERTEWHTQRFNGEPMTFATWAICPNDPDVLLSSSEYSVFGLAITERTHTGPELHVQERGIIGTPQTLMDVVTPVGTPGSEGYAKAVEETRPRASLFN